MSQKEPNESQAADDFDDDEWLSETDEVKLHHYQKYLAKDAEFGAWGIEAFAFLILEPFALELRGYRVLRSGTYKEFVREWGAFGIIDKAIAAGQLHLARGVEGKFLRPAEAVRWAVEYGHPMPTCIAQHFHCIEQEQPRQDGGAAVGHSLANAAGAYPQSGQESEETLGPATTSTTTQRTQTIKCKRWSDVEVWLKKDYLLSARAENQQGDWDITTLGLMDKRNNETPREAWNCLRSLVNGEGFWPQEGKQDKRKHIEALNKALRSVFRGPRNPNPVEWKEFDHDNPLDGPGWKANFRVRAG